MKLLILNIIVLLSISTFGQRLPIYKTSISISDEINLDTDRNFGVGDDGINRIAEPTITVSSELNTPIINFPGTNICDYNLETPWIIRTKIAKSEFVEFTYDFSKFPKNGKAISINSFFIINGYRDVKLWKYYTRIKKLKMYINNKPFAFILMQDTYKFQHVDFPNYWFNYGYIWKIKLEIIEVFAGAMSKNAAVSEIQFDGKYLDQ